MARMAFPPTAEPSLLTRMRLSRAWALTLPAALTALWLVATPAGLLGKADAIGYAVCHRIDLRSFHLGERALPLCARCSGLYLGALMAGLTYALRGVGRSVLFPPRWIMALFALFGAAYIVDGVNSYLSFFPQAPQLYEPNNALRLTTGTLFGMAFLTVVLTEFNRSIWQEGSPRPLLGSARDLAWLLCMAGGLIAVVLSENPLLLYPLALLSSAGVLILLMGVYTVLAIIVLRRDNRATTWRDLSAPAVVGLTLAIAQIALLDLGRYVLTGTWGGFPL